MTEDLVEKTVPRAAPEIGSPSRRTEGGFLPSLQIVRFAAASMVLMHHLFQELAGPRLNSPVRDPTGIDWGSGVDMFFLVSGFIMCFLTFNHFGENGYWAEFVRRRLVRVVPLYWLFTSLMLVAVLAAPAFITHGDLSIGWVVSSYLFVPWRRTGGDIYPILALGWTLNYEVLFYACYSIALVFARRTALTGLAVAFIAAAVLGRLAPASWVAVTFWTDPIIIEFLIGVAVGRAYLLGVRLGPWTRVALVVAGLACSITFTRIGLTGIDGARLLWGGLPASLIVAGATLGPKGGAVTMNPLTRLLVLAGDASYSLYLSHMFSVRLLTSIWTKLHLHAPGAYLLAGMIFPTVVAIGVYLGIERPILAQLKTVLLPRRGLSA